MLTLIKITLIVPLITNWEILYPKDNSMTACLLKGRSNNLSTLLLIYSSSPQKMIHGNRQATYHVTESPKKPDFQEYRIPPTALLSEESSAPKTSSIPPHPRFFNRIFPDLSVFLIV